MHLETRIAVHELVQFLGAECEGGENFAGVVVFFAIGHNTGFDQRHDAVAEHFGMDAEVTLVGQLHDHCVRNAAVADLQRGTVRDHVGDVFADGFLYRANFWQTDFRNR